MKSFAVLLATTFFVPVASQADALLDVYRKALKKDPVFLSATANNKASKELTKQAKSFMYPTISGRATTSKIGRDNTNFQDNTYSLNLSQPLYNKKTLHGLRQTKHRVKSGDHLYLQAQQDLILRVSRAYFDILLSKENLTTAQSESKAIRTQLSQIKQQLDVGIATITDVSDTQARKDSAVFSVLSAETNLKINQEKLREIIGSLPSYLRPLKNKIPLLVPPPANVKSWVQKALKNSPLLQSQQSLTASAKEEVNVQRAGHYPTLNFVAGIDKNHNDLTTSRSSKNNRIGLQLDIPIFQGGFVRSRTREARHKHNASKSDLTKVQRQVQRRTREMYALIISDIKRIRAAEQLLRSTNVALNADKEGFEAGTRTSLDVLNTRSEVFRAKLGLSQSRYDYLYRTLQLKFVAGVLDEKDLKKISALLK